MVGSTWQTEKKEKRFHGAGFSYGMKPEPIS